MRRSPRTPRPGTERSEAEQFEAQALKSESRTIVSSGSMRSDQSIEQTGHMNKGSSTKHQPRKGGR